MSEPKINWPDLRMIACRAVFLCVIWAGAPAGPLWAGEVTVAVAANFLNPLRALSSEFEEATDHRVTVISGSTGQLYAQINNGAPFDILLAADRERPRMLADNGLGDPSSVFSYAIGRLALWSGQAKRVHEDTLANLLENDFRWFAIAEPVLAPYGAAARQTLEKLGIWRSIEPRIVRGQNIAQTFAMIETGNAELGMVALSQVLAYDGPGSYQAVPSELYDPIRQDAILLRRAAGAAAAREFLEFLKSPGAVAIIERYGYTRANPIE